MVPVAAVLEAALDDCGPALGAQSLEMSLIRALILSDVTL